MQGNLPKPGKISSSSRFLEISFGLIFRTRGIAFVLDL